MLVECINKWNKNSEWLYKESEKSERLIGIYSGSNKSGVAIRVSVDYAERLIEIHSGSNTSVASRVSVDYGAKYPSG